MEKKSLTIRKHSIGSLLVWSSALLPLLLWLLTESAEPRGRRFYSNADIVNAGQLAGLVGMAMLSIAFVLSSRARFLEDYFGGLDKMYRLHHRLGQTAFVLLLIHPVAHALRFIPDRFDRALLFLFPTHEKLAVNLGAYAFWGLLLLMTLTLFVKIPYDKWKLSHKFLGLVLIIGTIHMLTVQSTPGRPVAVLQNPLLRYYMFGLAALGVVFFCYKLIVLPLLSRRHMYTVKAVKRLSDEVLQIELSPRRRRVTFVPGQFVFVTFYQEGLSHEAHPFTICTVPEQRDIALTVKALGDFTRRPLSAASERSKCKGGGTLRPLRLSDGVASADLDRRGCRCHAVSELGAPHRANARQHVSGDVLLLRSQPERCRPISGIRAHRRAAGQPAGRARLFGRAGPPQSS